MDCTNSPCSINKPKDWDCIIEYSKGGVHPGYDVARRILNEFLENIKLENCEQLIPVSNAVLRQPGCIIRGTDFDHYPGKGVSYSGLRIDTNLVRYRYRTGMKIVEQYKDLEKSFGFDCGLKSFVLELAEDEFAVYSLEDVKDSSILLIHYICEKTGVLKVYQDDEILGTFDLTENNDLQILSTIKLLESESAKIKLHVTSGVIKIDSLHTK